MAQILTAVSLVLIAASVCWRFRTSLFADPVRVLLRLDYYAPGAQLTWDIVNTAAAPVTVTKLVVHGRRGSNIAVPPGLPTTLGPQDHLVLTTDADWSLLSARSTAAVDAIGREHSVGRRRLAAIQNQLRELIDRRVYTSSAPEFLRGATNLAMGVVILGLGFFMLMWVIATG